MKNEQRILDWYEKNLEKDIDGFGQAALEEFNDGADRARVFVLGAIQFIGMAAAEVSRVDKIAESMAYAKVTVAILRIMRHAGEDALERGRRVAGAD